jgi:hypothetical protein
MQQHIPTQIGESCLIPFLRRRALRRHTSDSHDVRRIKFYKRQHDIYPLWQTLRVFHRTLFCPPFQSLSYLSQKSNPMSRPIPTYHPVATSYAAELATNHQAAADIVLWSGWFCPFIQRTWIVLEEMGLLYQYKEVNPYLKEEAFLGMSEQFSRGFVTDY